MRKGYTENRDKSLRMAWGKTMEIVDSEIRKKNTVEKLRKEKEKKGIDKDTHNRAYIATRIKKYIEEGMKESDAVLRVIEEEPEIVKQFDYLEKAGVDLRVVFANWARSSMPKVEKPFSKGENR